MKSLFTTLIPLLLLSGCPESTAPPSTEGEGQGDEGEGNSGGPSPFSNPNDARFSVAPGEGVTLSGAFNYAGETPGSYRIDFQKRESANGPPMLVHTIELDAPGPWSLEVPKDYGPIYLTGFVDLKGDGPSPDDPIGRTTTPTVIGSEPIDGIDLVIALGNDAGIAAPPQPGENKHSDAPPGTPQGSEGGDAPPGAPPPDAPPPDAPPPGAPPPDAPAPSEAPPSDGPPADG